LIVTNLLHLDLQVFLERSGARAVNSDTLRTPNPDCQVCGIAQSRLVIDPSRATLNDLVDGVLRLELGYGEEFTVNNEVGTVYDPDLEDNLEKRFDELGIKDESFLTIIDDDDEEPRVNLQLSISSKALPQESKPVILTSRPAIARRQKLPTALEMPTDTNGNAASNGVLAAPSAKKRGAEEAGLEDDRTIKREKVKPVVSNGDDSTIVLDDTVADGAIVINDE